MRAAKTGRASAAGVNADLGKADKAYPMFVEKRDECIKVVLDPAA